MYITVFLKIVQVDPHPSYHRIIREKQRSLTKSKLFKLLKEFSSFYVIPAV